MFRVSNKDTRTTPLAKKKNKKKHKKTKKNSSNKTTQLSIKTGKMICC